MSTPVGQIALPQRRHDPLDQFAEGEPVTNAGFPAGNGPVPVQVFTVTVEIERDGRPIPRAHGFRPPGLAASRPTGRLRRLSRSASQGPTAAELVRAVAAGERACAAAGGTFRRQLGCRQVDADAPEARTQGKRRECIRPARDLFGMRRSCRGCRCRRNPPCPHHPG